MIKIGTSGFQFADWVGPIYPDKTKPHTMLAYYEKILGFDTVELNYTFYSLPSQKTMHGLLRKTSESFEFVVRSHQNMTHAIWTDETRTYFKDTSETFMQFLYGIKPLIEEGRLGCVLLQFPYFFLPQPLSFEYLKQCCTLLPRIPLVIEFRNHAWLNAETFEFLRNHRMGFCIVDEPPLKNLMPAVFETTSSIGYFRLHGRNKKWFGASKEERYNYAYTHQELSEFLPHIKKIEKQVDRLYIFFNNCYSGHAAQNARMIKELLTQ